MSLFDNLGGLLQNAMNSNSGGMSGLVAQALSAVGGMEGVVTKLNDAGLGTKVNSWLGNGDNMPLTADEVRNALGNEHLGQLSASLGLPLDQITNMLAQHLPASVDAASPNGTLVSNN